MLATQMPTETLGGGEVLNTKDPTGMCRQHGQHNQPFGMGQFFKILEKMDDFSQNWADCYMNGSLFLKNWYLYGSTFNFAAARSLPKPNLSTPPKTLSNIFHKGSEIHMEQHIPSYVLYTFNIHGNLLVHYES